MKRTMINAVEVTNESVQLSGWVHRIKRLKSVVFVILRDRTGFIQLAIKPERFGNIKLESVITVTGQVIDNANKFGSFEIQVREIEVLSNVEADLPIAINNKNLEIGLDTLLNNRVLSHRHKQTQGIFKIQNSLTDGFRNYLNNESFHEIHSPKLVKEGAEGGANVFSLDYFGEKAYLAQSPQFYKQMMVIAGYERVFEISAVYRAESHSTSRHLNEYISLDLEMGFITDEYELMRFETELLRSMLNHTAKSCKEILAEMVIELPIVPEVIPTMKLEEAIEILKTQYNKKHLEGDLDPESEQLIYEHVYKKTGSEFLFLTDYPQSKRPMYTMTSGETSTRSFDLLFRGLEITTGGLRIHDIHLLKERMIAKGLNPSEYMSYLEAFKYGAPPHGGLAIGLERLTSKLLNLNNVRYAASFPRDMNRLLP